MVARTALLVHSVLLMDSLRHPEVVLVVVTVHQDLFLLVRNHVLLDRIVGIEWVSQHSVLLESIKIQLEHPPARIVLLEVIVCLVQSIRCSPHAR